VITGGTTASPATPFVGATGKLTANDQPSGGVSATAGTFATSAGGSVTIANDGTFVYTPKANPGAVATTSDSFTYTVFSNTGGGGAVTSAPATVNLTLAGRVWYVLNTAGGGGNGQSQAPFNLLSNGVSASTADDTIYVYQGDGTTANLATASVLKPGQDFIGQGAALVVNGNNLVAAGGFPPDR
jgi:VCBS repeat-containing protein